MFLKEWNEFRTYWKNYVFQSLLATLAMVLVLFVLSLQNAMVVASIGATSFIIFAMPNSISARTRNVAGGHGIGLIFGMTSCLLIPHISIHPIFMYSLAVGLSIFFMVVLDMEHPPATGTALGIASTPLPWKSVIAVISAVLILSFIHMILKNKIRDLV